MSDMAWLYLVLLYEAIVAGIGIVSCNPKNDPYRGWTGFYHTVIFNSLIMIGISRLTGDITTTVSLGLAIWLFAYFLLVDVLVLSWRVKSIEATIDAMLEVVKNRR